MTDVNLSIGNPDRVRAHLYKNIARTMRHVLASNLPNVLYFINKIIRCIKFIHSVNLIQNTSTHATYPLRCANAGYFINVHAFKKSRDYIFGGCENNTLRKKMPAGCIRRTRNINISDYGLHRLFRSCIHITLL